MESVSIGETQACSSILPDGTKIIVYDNQMDF